MRVLNVYGVRVHIAQRGNRLFGTFFKISTLNTVADIILIFTRPMHLMTSQCFLLQASGQNL